MKILKTDQLALLKEKLDNISIDYEKLLKRLIDDKKIIVICGPTGIGKTSLGINIAQVLNTDIISADSMQVYKGMDIGTDKINTGKYGIKQYMVDIFEPGHSLTVMEFSDIARNIISDRFFQKKKIPLIVGGSGLYIKSIIDDLDKGPGKDPDFRNRIEEDINRNGLQKYYKELMEIDRDYALKISKNDRRRIIRALEVFHHTGMPFSRFQKKWLSNTVYNVSFIGLDKDRKLLYEDIEERVGQMFEAGLLEEVKNLLSTGYRDSQGLVQAVGYKEIIAFLEKKTSLEECVNEVKKNSRRLAKKQMTWFGRDNRINWIRVDNYDNMFDLIIDTLKILDREL
jgi:tRNA dimethylallyltransferase